MASITGLRGTFRSIGGATGTALIVLVVSRSESTARGLEVAFAGLGIISLASIVLVRWTPDAPTRAARREPVEAPA